MVMEQIRQFHCKLCDYIKVLRKGETISKCPACNDGNNPIYILSKKDTESIREDMINWMTGETK